ncbi:MAG TPA: PASTA domain-containing protein [Marmoricola sp.]|jgi:hypothetical protein|nr:PASTA domain-containing protein [Marmoricola sp.]
MTDQDLTDLLESVANTTTVGPAPLSEITTGAERRRRRRRWRAASAGTVAIAAMIGTAMVLAPGQTSKPAHVTPTPAEVPAGMRLVGYGHAAIAVPDAWGTNDTRCGTPVHPTVIIDESGTVLCLFTTPRTVDNVQVALGVPPSQPTPTHQVTIDGVPARRNDAVCRDEPIGLHPSVSSVLCTGTVYVPSAGTSFTAESATAEGVDMILSRIEITPNLVGVPGLAPFAFNPQMDAVQAQQAYADTLRAADFAVQFRTEQHSGLRAGTLLRASPGPGSMLPPGSVVTVIAAAAN